MIRFLLCKIEWWNMHMICNTFKCMSFIFRLCTIVVRVVNSGKSMLLGWHYMGIRPSLSPATQLFIWRLIHTNNIETINGLHHICARTPQVTDGFFAQRHIEMAVCIWVASSAMICPSLYKILPMWSPLNVIMKCTNCSLSPYRIDFFALLAIS